MNASSASSAAGNSRRSWLAAVGATAATYIYFLIFSEFAFLATATRVAGDSPVTLRAVLFGLGGGGIAGALLAARFHHASRSRRQLQAGFLACAVSALLTLVPTSAPGLGAAGFGSGLALGWLTVVLAASLRRATAHAHLGLAIGAGTGLAYGLCNVPALFNATPAAQTVFAAAVAAAAALLPRAMQLDAATAPASAPLAPISRPVVIRWVAVLLPLVWLDSAAFYLIQHTPELRDATWQGAPTLAANAAMHVLAALGAGLLLDRGARRPVAAAAVLLLGAGCVALSFAGSWRSAAPWFYTAGVSLYSTLLVEFPARSGRASVAAAVYAVAGWFGSGLGIGLAQDRQRVPPLFVAAAVIAVGVALFARSRRGALVAAAAGLAVAPASSRAAEPEPLVALGREVYIAEGCLHCHSQYVRRRAPDDIERWGPASSLDRTLAHQPPLFGTRRQGPDLAQVGNRRSAEWHRLHLIRPRELSPGSRMPSFAYLFSGDASRGEALIAYLSSLGADSVPERQAAIARWTPAAVPPLDATRSAALFAKLCSGCHGSSGQGDGPIAARLSLPPPNWQTQPWHNLRPDADVPLQLARIVKFGLPGRPMAGHEYLPDHEILGLARHVGNLHPGIRAAPSGVSQ
jgi:cytochrome c oxidase cbb3-type subunit 2